MFENLHVCRNAVDLTDRISGLTEGFPRGYYFLADQLNRAADATRRHRTSAGDRTRLPRVRHTVRQNDERT
jgi:hypothetical protein